MENVVIEIYVEQIENGIEYKGLIVIGSKKFDYNLKFAVSIDDLDRLNKFKDVTKMRQTYGLTLFKKCKIVDLTDAEYLFFLQMLLEFVMKFYMNGRNTFVTATVRMLLTDVGSNAKDIVATQKIAASDRSCYRLPGELLQIFDHPKFS